MLENPTEAQRQILYSQDKRLLVSASAGTGKTTVMVERISELIKKGADISEFVLVTYTNLAAAEMKKRLVANLADEDSEHMREQLEKIDTASISTLHVFCAELLRNYFYVVDVDPSFGILEGIQANTLKQTALDQTFAFYRQTEDATFEKLFKIFTPNRREDSFREELLKLYEFGKCLPDFETWYNVNIHPILTTYNQNSAVVNVLFDNLRETLTFAENSWQNLLDDISNENAPYLQNACKFNMQAVGNVCTDNVETTLQNLMTLTLQSKPTGKQSDKNLDKNVRDSFNERFDTIVKITNNLIKKYSDVLQNRTLSETWEDVKQDAVLTQKLVEMVLTFDKNYSALKKQRGVLDFNDLEHFALKALENDEVLSAVRARYKYVFVDEYQDINPIQEAIVTQISHDAVLFMVGDVKQSIYGFRHCDPSIFVEKHDTYLQNGCGAVVEMNDNFRSNNQILDFVNIIFKHTMTRSFGKVDYANNMIAGTILPCMEKPSVQVDLVVEKDNKSAVPDGIYDIEENFPNGENDFLEGEVIAKRVLEYVNTPYTTADGKQLNIGFGDIVILMSKLTARATSVYESLVAHNIPVVASFKRKGYHNKEVRDIITLLRAIDNPYDNVAFVGACLTCFGGFTKNELAEIRVATAEDDCDFAVRLQKYVSLNPSQPLSAKIDAFFAFMQDVRVFSHSTTVDNVVLKIVSDSYFTRYVSGMPNSSLRLEKLYAFVNDLKGKYYSQSITKFLQYLSEAENADRTDEGVGQVNAVRLMTMHSSKGLEFPVVIVAGLEAQKPNENQKILYTNKKIGPSIHHYNFTDSKKCESPVRMASELVSDREQKEESMRLLYVALTRAKYALDIITKTTEKKIAFPPIPTNAVCHADLVLYALQQHLGKISERTDKKLSIKIWNEVAFDGKDTLFAENSAENTYTCEPKRLPELDWQYSYFAERGMPMKLTCSALDDAFFYNNAPDTVAVTLEDEVPQRNLLGTAYHAIYQYANYNATREEIAETVQWLCNEQLIDDAVAKQIDVELIYRTLNNDNFRKLLCQGNKIYHEIPFMLSVPYNQVKDDAYHDNTMLQGVIDLLIVGKSKAIVVDFKYTNHPDKIHINYKKQLNAYKKAVMEITGVDTVEAYVLSITTNQLIKM